MSFFVSSSSGSGSGFVFGSFIGGGRGDFSSGFADYSASGYAPSKATTYHRKPSVQKFMFILIFLAFPISSVILLMVGNAVLRDYGKHHLPDHDMAAAAAIGGIFLFVTCIAALFLFIPLLGRYKIVVEAPPPGVLVIFLIGFFGAPLCGVLGVAPLLVKKDRFKIMDLLYATEAGFIGAFVLVGGWCTLLFCLMLLFNPSSAGFFVAQLLHLKRRHIRERSSEPETTVPAMDVLETVPSDQ